MVVPPPSWVVMSTLWGSVSLLSKWMTTGLLALRVSVFLSHSTALAARSTLVPGALGAALVVVVRSLAVAAGDLLGAVVVAVAWPGAPPPVPVTETVPVMLG